MMMCKSFSFILHSTERGCDHLPSSRSEVTKVWVL